MESGQSEIGFLRTIVEEYSEEKSPLIRETRPPSNFSIPDIPWTIIHDLRRVEERGGQGFANIESSRWKINAFAKSYGEERRMHACTDAWIEVRDTNLGPTCSRLPGQARHFRHGSRS